MSLSSRYSNFNEFEKKKFEQCSAIINKNILKLKKNYNIKILNNIKNELVDIGINKIDYCEIRNEENLKVSYTKIKSRLFIGFYLNAIRVIDNFILY